MCKSRDILKTVTSAVICYYRLEYKTCQNCIKAQFFLNRSADLRAIKALYIFGA